MIPLRGADIEVSRLAFRIQEELVKPLRELDITDTEFACLRTVVFFSPGRSTRGALWVVISLPLPLDLIRCTRQKITLFDVLGWIRLFSGPSASVV